MKDVFGQLKRLDSLLNALIAEQQLLKKENESLKAELLNRQAEVDLREDELQKVKAELKNLRLARGLENNPENAKLAKDKLSSLMREIDRCIALLNE
jgi:hypothetical protein